MKLIFDLDLTLIDSSIAKPYRPGKWGKVYELIPSFTLYEGIRESLNYLNENNIPFCIVTSAPSTYCGKVCSHWRIGADFMVCYHDTPPFRKKPHPAPIELGIAKLNARPEDVFSFGDSDTDIVASNAANTKSVACLWGAENSEALIKANPLYIIESPSEIISLLMA